MPKKKSIIRKNKSRSKIARRKQKGGRVLMPIQYFGGELNRYFPEGSPYLKPLPNAYGPTIARSFGTSDKILTPYNLTSPNLAPFGLGSRGENLSCGIQTGGRRVKKSKSKKSKRSTKTSKKSLKKKNKRTTKRRTNKKK